MFIDRVVIEVRSGKGGDGAIAFRREKYVPKGGPSGGNGGRGASIYLRANKAINTLFNFRHSKTIIGPEGEKGGIKNQFGKCAEDVIVDVPVGTVVYLEENHRCLGDLDKDGKMIRVAKGGRGGRGNTCFKSPTNRAPRIAENGEPGENKRLILELKLLADVGVVGLPNVGKSTFLSVVTSARPEIADYPFTTIIPNLGVVYRHEESFVIADLPGLIAGAHQGKGLGLQFLRHIERCRLIIHMVDMSDNGRDPFEDYQTIINELKEYGLGLIERRMIIVASKMDEEGAQAKLKKLQKSLPDQKIFPISSLGDEGLGNLLDECISLLSQIPFKSLVDEDEFEDVKVYSLEGEEKEFEILHPEAHRFVITGDQIIKYYKMTNISTDEGMLKLLAHFRHLGIDDELEKMGAKNGDTVEIADFAFDYVE